MNVAADDSVLEGVRILVVEDDPANARMLALLLTSAGADVQVALTAHAALDVLQHVRPHVVILDLVLPGMSGLALAEALQATPSTRNIILIAVSVVDGPETERRALAAGCSAYVRKPIDADSFIQILMNHLKGHV